MVEKCSVNDLFASPNWDALIAEYTAESSIHDMPPINPQVDSYLHLESLGVFHCFRAVNAEGSMIGFITVLSTPFLHYGAPVLTTESYFVAQEYRRTGAGLRLIRAVEAYAREIDAAGVFISSPAGGKLESVAPKMGYRHTNTVFFKAC